MASRRHHGDQLAIRIYRRVPRALIACRIDRERIFKPRLEQSQHRDLGHISLQRVGHDTAPPPAICFANLSSASREQPGSGTMRAPQAEVDEQLAGRGEH